MCSVCALSCIVAGLLFTVYSAVQISIFRQSLTMKNLTSALLCLLNPKVWTVAQNMTELFNILYFFSLGKNSMRAALWQNQG